MSDARAVELGPDERRVVDLVKQVRGMGTIPDAEIVEHLRDVLATTGVIVRPETLIAEALRFRDYWNGKRMSQTDTRWRGWRAAMTNWFSRTKPDAPERGNPLRAHPSAQQARRDRNLTVLSTYYHERQRTK